MAGESRAARTVALTAAARPAQSSRWVGLVAWTLWALTLGCLAVLPWLDRLLREADRPELAPLTPNVVAWMLGSLSGPRSGRSWPAAGPGTRWAGCW
jgi:hypothetical protein